MTAQTQAAKLIATRVRKGANPDESAALLEELATVLHGDNLAHALAYNAFTTAASAERAAHALEIEHVDEHVRQIAAALPFPVALEADMGGTFVHQIHLGSRTAEGPADRAGIDPHEPGATWWIETEGGEQFEQSRLRLNSTPAQVAAWIAQHATALGCPAATSQTISA